MEQESLYLWLILNSFPPRAVLIFAQPGKRMNPSKVQTQDQHQDNMRRCAAPCWNRIAFNPLRAARFNFNFVNWVYISIYWHEATSIATSLCCSLILGLSSGPFPALWLTFITICVPASVSWRFCDLCNRWKELSFRRENGERKVKGGFKNRWIESVDITMRLL